MIFVTVGTWHSGFDRLVNKIDNLVEAGRIAERVVAQIGNGRYRPKHLDIIEFCSPEEFERLVRESRMVVTHAGVGAMMTAILNDRPVVVLPRRADLGEVANDHQFITARQFEEEGLILVALDEEQLEAKCREAISFHSRNQANGLENIRGEVRNFLQQIEG